MKEKGATIIWIILFLFLAVSIIGGTIYLKSKDNTSSKGTPIQSVNEHPPTNSISTQTPVTSPSFIPLVTVWEKGLTTYNQPELGITFQYPNFFIPKVTNPREEKERMSYYAQKNKDYQFPSYMVTFSVPQLSDEQITNAQNADSNFYGNYTNNIMWIKLAQYDNQQQLPLYNFIANQYKVYAGSGREMTFDDFKQKLKEISIPFPHSYENSNSISESPNKIAFFEVEDKIYEMTLGGGLQTGEGYSPEAEKIFSKILQTIKAK